jgi:hypothetical protein
MLKQEELINDAKHNRLAGKKERKKEEDTTTDT